MASFTTSLISDEREARRLGQILSQCFNAPVADWEQYRNSIGIENFRVIRQGSNIVGGLAIYPMGQWFDGACLPMAGIAGVAIAPEYRGSGAARTLMSDTVKELYERGIPLSTLYPATQRLYRQVGYEQGGKRCRWQVPLAEIPIGSHQLPLQRIFEPSLKLFLELYRQQAQQSSGYLERHPAIWQRLLDSSQFPVYAYWVGEESRREGYILFQQMVIDNDAYIGIRDWVATTPTAISRLWTFLGDHRSQVKYCNWFAGMTEPKLMLLPEQSARITDSLTWMMRIVNVVKALTIRPYPPLETELHLAIEDNLIASNHSRICLTVSQGRGEVKQGGTGALQLNIRALASLYTGLLTPAQLKSAGYLEASDAALQIATQLFAPLMPSMPDFF